MKRHHNKNLDKLHQIFCEQPFPERWKVAFPKGLSFINLLDRLGLQDISLTVFNPRVLDFYTTSIENIVCNSRSNPQKLPFDEFIMYLMIVTPQLLEWVEENKNL